MWVRTDGRAETWGPAHSLAGSWERGLQGAVVARVRTRDVPGDMGPCCWLGPGLRLTRGNVGVAVEMQRQR